MSDHDPAPAAPDPSGSAPVESSIPEIAFSPVPVRRRRDGWTAERQRRFITLLAETGNVRLSAEAVGMTDRSAHRLAIREDAEDFSHAWDAALRVCARRGVSKLYEYAFEGALETVWRDGAIAYQRRKPSEKALMFLLGRLDPARFGRQPPPNPDAGPVDPVGDTLADFELYLQPLHDLPPDEGEEGEDDVAETPAP